KNPRALSSHRQFWLASPKAGVRSLLILVLSFCGVWEVWSASVEGGGPSAVQTSFGTPRIDETQEMIATLLLDQYSDALAAYSLRRLSSAYTGPALRIRRVSDGAEQDIGFDDSGLVNTQILEDFCAATDCRVVTWYSQLAGVPDAKQSKL